LGEIGKGRGRGALLHAMLAVDADNGGSLGLVSGSLTARSAGRVEIAHAKRALADKESRRWIDTAMDAKVVLSEARCVTVVADRESDIYAEWAMLPAENFHLLTRAMHDRSVAGGGTLSSAAAGFAFAGTRTVELSANAKRIKRDALLNLRFGRVEISRPQRRGTTALPESISLSLVEVIELNPPAGVEPVQWRLLTSHDVADAASAWQIVDWYRQRWIIEQFFRVLKTQGFQIEDSQIASAYILLELIAVAAKAAAITIQLLQARDGHSDLPATAAFDPSQRAALAALNARYEAKTTRQKNPHPQASMAWACGSLLASADGTAIARRGLRDQSRPRSIPGNRHRMGTQRCVHPVAFKGGGTVSALFTAPLVGHDPIAPNWLGYKPQEGTVTGKKMLPPPTVEAMSERLRGVQSRPSVSCGGGAVSSRR
jgi:hypothetical protein